MHAAPVGYSGWFGAAPAFPRHDPRTERRRNGDRHSAFRRLALLADGPALLGLLDVLRGVRGLARADQVHRNGADLRPGLERKVRECLHVTAHCDDEAVHYIA